MSLRLAAAEPRSLTPGDHAWGRGPCSQGRLLPTAGCPLTGVLPFPSRVLCHRGVPFPQQDAPSQGCPLPPAGCSLTVTGVLPSPSRMLPHRGTPLPPAGSSWTFLLQMGSSMYVAALPCLSLMLLLWSPGPWVRGQEFQFGPCQVDGIVLQKLWQAFWAMKDIVVSEVLFWTQPWREVILGRGRYLTIMEPFAAC